MIKKKIKKENIEYVSERDEKGLKSVKLKDKLKQCQKEKEEYLTQAQRARADLINYRKRQETLIPELVAMGQAGIIGDAVLPLLDALEAGAKENKDIKRIKEQVVNILNKHKMEEIKAVGEKFNPELHEAIDVIESKKESEMIVEETQKGYIFNNKVLRPSKVRVSK